MPAPRLRMLAGLLLGIAALAPWGVRPAMAGPFSAEVLNAPVDLGDTFELVLKLVDGDSVEPPNVAPLTKDFEILNRRKMGGKELMGGREVSTTSWILVLAPKRAGRLTIPAVTVAGETSAPQTLVVLPGVVRGPPNDDPGSVQIDVVNTGSAFVLSEIPVRVRVFDRTGAIVAGRSLRKAPVADGLPLAQASEWRAYPRTFNGQRYWVIEGRFVFRPQRDGTITIEPASVLIAPPNGEPNERNITQIVSAPVDVTVLPRPPEVTGWFLPAQSVKISRAWQSSPAAAKAGVALSTTITLVAVGAGPNQLPPIPMAEVDGVRQYPADAEPQAASLDGVRGAVLVEPVSIVPTRAGTVTLPAITIPWWNVATRKMETAVLPEETITVAPSDAQAAPLALRRPTVRPAGAAAAPLASSPLASGSQPAGDITGNASPGDVVAGGTVAEAVPDMPAGGGFRLPELLRGMVQGSARDGLLAVAGGGVLVLMVLLLVRRRGAPRMAPPAGERRAPDPRRPSSSPSRLAALPKADATDLARAVTAACRAGDAAAAHAAYLAWYWSVPGRARADTPHAPEMAAALGEVGRHLYGGAAGWDGRAFRKAFAAEQKALRKGARRAGAPRLAPLYPGAGSVQ